MRAQLRVMVGSSCDSYTRMEMRRRGTTAKSDKPNGRQPLCLASESQGSFGDKGASCCCKRQLTADEKSGEMIMQEVEGGGWERKTADSRGAQQCTKWEGGEEEHGNTLSSSVITRRQINLTGGVLGD